MEKCWKLLVLLCAAASLASAEMRIWTDKKGNTIEAEFKGMMGNKVILKTPQGKTMQVPAAGLCSADQKFLAANIPPKMNIDVDVDKDRETLSSVSYDFGDGWERKAETISCTVDIKKTNREECSKKFKAVIYVFGENQESKRTRLLETAEKEFNFKYSKQTTFNSEPVTVEYFDSSYRGKDGYRYAGYLVAIYDNNGGVIEMESTKNAYKSYVVNIKKAHEGDIFDSNFNVVKGKKKKRRVY